VTAGGGRVDVCFACDCSGEKCLAFVQDNATPSDPKSVLEAIDTFGYEHHWMMNVGDVKGELVDQEIAKVKPKVHPERNCHHGGTR
jgi:hypothetical protein